MTDDIEYVVDARHEGDGATYPQALRENDVAQYAALDRPDAKEGAAALMEKRAPACPRLGDASASDTDNGGNQ